MRVRELTRADLAEASRLLVAEGWAFPPEDLYRLLRIGTAVGAERDGALAGVAFLAVYGQLAWIGNVVVAAASRGAGVGAALVGALLEAARRAGVETVRLHSVHRAESLYERLGFVREGLVHAFRRAPDAPPVPAAAAPPLDDALQVRAFDAERFGADRGRLLQLLLAEQANRGFLLREATGAVRGYLVLKTSVVASEIGPGSVRAGDEGAMRALLDAALAVAPAGPLEWAVPGDNRPALALARERGLVEAFTARTMRWGNDAHRGDPAAILAAGGLEKG